MVTRSQLPEGRLTNEHVVVKGQRLGRLPLKSTLKALQYSNFFEFLEVPKSTKVWSKRSALPNRTFGNTLMGNCTRAKQAYAAIRMERLEQKKTIDITDDEVIRVYREMSDRLYGGGDNGAYEDDALSEWRNPDTTFRDTKGRPHTIDGYLRINAHNHQEVKSGIAFSGAKGIAVRINLPIAFSDKSYWDVPEGQPLIGEYMPGSWGGHSMYMIEYDQKDCTVDDTWGHGPRKISWRAIAAYMDEAHLVIDSVNTWRKATTNKKIRKGLGDFVDAVNSISSLPIAA